MKLHRPVLLAVLAALALAGCGSSSHSAAVTDVPTVKASPPTSTPTAAPAATTPATAATGSTSSQPTTSTGSGTTTAPNPGGASPDETNPGGAGDEEPIRQPARFVLSATDVTPASISVAPFLAVALRVVNQSAAAHTVKLVGTDTTFDVPAGGSVERRLPGLKAGMYTLAVDGGKAAASLVVGDNAGP